MAGLCAAGTGDAYVCRLLMPARGPARWLASGLVCQRVAVDDFEFDAALRRAGVETVNLYMAFVAPWGRMFQQTGRAGRGKKPSCFDSTYRQW